MVWEARMIFENREDAGRLLGQKIQQQLKASLHRNRLIVLGLPRGGIVVARKVARILHAPLGLEFVCKLRHPESPEFAIGAVAESDKAVYSEGDIKHIDPAWLRLEEESARELIDMRRELYFEGKTKPAISISNHTAVLVDDGIATGMTMLAAIQYAFNKGANKIIVVAPVASEEAAKLIIKTGAELYLLEDVQAFYGSVGMHYKNFEQVSDLDVRRTLSDYL